jgi:hypothetical protein
MQVVRCFMTSLTSPALLGAGDMRGEALPVSFEAF